jgi:hypothetical protein
MRGTTAARRRRRKGVGLERQELLEPALAESLGKEGLRLLDPYKSKKKEPCLRSLAQKWHLR